MKITYSSIIENTMEIQIAEKVWGKLFCIFKINDSILKTHFKELMKIAKKYDAKEKIGLIILNDKELFLLLCEKIEKSSDKKCKNSHLRSIETRKNRNKKISCKHEDLGSLGYKHGETVSCPYCGASTVVW